MPAMADCFDKKKLGQQPEQGRCVFLTCAVLGPGLLQTSNLKNSAKWHAGCTAVVCSSNDTKHEERMYKGAIGDTGVSTVLVRSAVIVVGVAMMVDLRKMHITLLTLVCGCTGSCVAGLGCCLCWCSWSPASFLVRIPAVMFALRAGGCLKQGH